MQKKHTGMLAFALLLVAALSGAWAYMVSDEERFAMLEKGADAVFDRLLPV
jgi:hypothetical protein